MTALRTEIISALEQVPDNQLEKVFDFIKNLLGNDENTPEMKAYKEMHEILRRNNVCVPEDFDYRDEVSKAVLEKYENIG